MLLRLSYISTKINIWGINPHTETTNQWKASF